jgi:hypothetical protein
MTSVWAGTGAAESGAGLGVANGGAAEFKATGLAPGLDTSAESGLIESVQAATQLSKRSVEICDNVRMGQNYFVTKPQCITRLAAGRPATSTPTATAAGL